MTWVAIVKWVWRKLIEAKATPEGGVGTSIELGSGYSTEGEPMKPETVWEPSPNFKEARDREISVIVLHATATAGLSSPLSWLCNPESKVSAHYLIDTDGTIYHLVLDENIAWHAGASEWDGRSGVNAFSIGIELVNKNDGSGYDKAQVFSCAKLCKYLMAEHSIPAEAITDHATIAPGRKNDPLGFPWDALREALAAV